MVLLPILFMLNTSLKSINEILTSSYSTFLPKKISFEGYINIWKNYPFLIYLRNSVIVTLGATFFCVFFSTLGGYGFSRFEFKGKSQLMFLVLVTQMFPSVMLFIPFYKILSIYGLSKSLVGLVIVHLSFIIPLSTWMMFGFYESVPKELNDAASIDGCNSFTTFIRIISPLVLPGIITTVIYSFIQCWNEYMFTMIIANTDSMKTLTVAIGEMSGHYKVMWNDLMAASTISSLPLIIAFIGLQKYFISSLTQGSVKG